MRELPEPEVSEEIAEAQRFLSMWKSVTTRPMTTREVEFAKLVRKQAYEDGLRDAKLSPVVRYGCHCDLEPHMEPDGCVLDYGAPQDCVHAGRSGATKEGCEYWKPIMLTASQKEAQSLRIDYGVTKPHPFKD